MNTKEIKITVPEGYEIDKENSTFECIKFKKKGLTYEDVAEKLFTDRVAYFIGDGAAIDSYIPSMNDEIHLANQATSAKQLQRLLAINKLMNVAEYLNEGWKFIENGDKIEISYSRLGTITTFVELTDTVPTETIVSIAVALSFNKN